LREYPEYVGYFAFNCGGDDENPQQRTTRTALQNSRRSLDLESALAAHNSVLGSKAAARPKTEVVVESMVWPASEAGDVWPRIARVASR
jgi:hypothetical protein